MGEGGGWNVAAVAVCILLAVSNGGSVGAVGSRQMGLAPNVRETIKRSLLNNGLGLTPQMG